ncbi:MAG: NIL domain-containing protein [Merismopediaceae bacterium]|nr:NIL domain-containing protein [Merismopediaceae bacterium]
MVLLSGFPTLNPNGNHPLANTIQKRIRLQIPSRYQQEPIISQLASRYHLEVSILAAILGANAQGSGWFDLQLTGQSNDIDQALAYLNSLGVEILTTSDQENDSW